MFEQMTNAEALTRLWGAFLKTPGVPTADALAAELEKDEVDGLIATTHIAEALARRPAPERSDLSRLLVSRLFRNYKLGLGLLKATAKAEVPAPSVPLPQRASNVEGLDLIRPADLPKLTDKTLGGRDRLLLEGLDLAGAETISLTELERRCDDAADATSITYLRAAMGLLAPHLTGHTSYTHRRSQKLTKTPETTQDHLIEQLGFRAAQSRRKDLPGLSPANFLAANYWRSDFPQAIKRFQTKLKSLKLEPTDILVNSPRVLAKLSMTIAQQDLAELSIRPLIGDRGVSVLRVTKAYQGPELRKALEDIGAAPSPYQLYELMDLGKQLPGSDYDLDTYADLAALITSSRFAHLRRIAAGKGTLSPACAMLEHLVLGLTDSLGPKRHDPLTANALATLYTLLDLVVATDLSPALLLRVADLMIDEISLVLAAAKYYTWTDYREVRWQILAERAPSIKDLAGDRIEVSSHLMTSGMDALATALFIALSTRGHHDVVRATESLDYFEFSGLLGKLKTGATAAPHQDVLVAALNPSTPFDKPAADKLIGQVQSSILSGPGDTPFALIIDTTLEVDPADTGGRSQLDEILHALLEAVAAGRLEIFLCKSFQKYASLGTGKVAGGDLTLLTSKGNLESAHARYEALAQDLALALDEHDEAQTIIHMLRHAHRDELALVHNAAANAKFVDDFCWPTDRLNQRQGSSYVDGIPLLLRATLSGDVDELFDKKLTWLDRRDSFSFLRTSYVGGISAANNIEGPFVRLNLGHESRAMLVEYLYAVGHLATCTLPGRPVLSGKPLDLAALSMVSIREHLDALAVVPSTDTTGVERYRSNIFASYCLVAAAVMPSPADAVPLLVEFFARPGTRGTTETQRLLARALFTNLNNLFQAEPAFLTALGNAAAVLPPKEAARLAPGLKPKVDDIVLLGPPAQRLSDLLS
ncbi:hypothetical protein [Dactylosporangium matsuzakiense]|uniref:Uncharacterized protein n=1 Tax=Dactylosporangium matsuzakiense TaxID=53360 RepID=A0A9W6NRT4_9ACTN|nr:hypothetical protein [Dactylosporangium matsuzakiense]GLL06929.1 hypothetical protein GCM10017581_086790 [Dactylosporangium matsuzakiense]